jgi:hypothetical protein
LGQAWSSAQPCWALDPPLTKVLVKQTKKWKFCIKITYFMYKENIFYIFKILTTRSKMILLYLISLIKILVSIFHISKILYAFIVTFLVLANRIWILCDTIYIYWQFSAYLHFHFFSDLNSNYKKMNEK